MTDHRCAMIMAGGSGTRLWPMSRLARPKQMIPFIDGESLLALAGRRLDGIVDPANRLVCAAREWEPEVRRAVPRLAKDGFLGEPTARDTLNAVGLTAAVLAARDPEAVFMVMTSDHLIDPQPEFAKCAALGFALVEADRRRFVTFAITPTHAATGYGYVERGEGIAGFAGAFRAKRFHEKPDLARAMEYIGSGSFGWNSGLFVFHAGEFMDALARHHADTARGLTKIAAAWGKPSGPRVIDEIYPSLKKISVDHGLLEPASRDDRVAVCVIPMSVSWRDVGSWPAFGTTLDADASGNRTSALTHLDAARRNIIVSDDPRHMIAAVGVEGLVIVHTRDATLVCRAEDAERVKELAAGMPVDYR